ncbi:Sterol 3-beta-glucosyltransferase [Gossypium arboreum]|uniref:Sterol 3-beta-glucosyltransferase n=1 Tax=Gossypium arboreum TaxID=29729 RepID=A0A0B0MZJ5_GOSAR|nr:Sterol 3-beta-glucosyltransferase [Gossypium arboreum]
MLRLLDSLCEQHRIAMSGLTACCAKFPSIRRYYFEWFTDMSKMRIRVSSFRDGTGMYIKIMFIESREMMNSSVAKLARIGDRRRFASHYQNYHFGY